MKVLIDQESGFDPTAGEGRTQEAAAGLGLLQLNYAIARWAGYEGEPEGLLDPQENLQAGARYFAYLLNRYQGDVRSALAAYHAGPRPVDREGWQVASAYVERVLQRMEDLRPEVEAIPQPPVSFEPEPGIRFPLDVPYVSQLMPGPRGTQGYNNCGPACATMAVLYNQLVAPSADALQRVAADIRGQPWWVGTYTSFGQMQQAAAAYQIPNRYLSTWAEVYGALDRGQPVLILVDNSTLEPRQYDRSPSWNAHHFILLTGYDDAVFHVNDPLRYYGWPNQGPGQYTVASVKAGVGAVGGVQALAIDRLPPGVPDAGAPEGSTEATEGEEVAVPATDEELKSYLEQLGQTVNMDSAIIKRACLSYRRGETRGPAISDEYPATTESGQSVVRQKFTAGIAEYNPATGDTVWVEVVAHPNTIAT